MTSATLLLTKTLRTTIAGFLLAIGCTTGGDPASTSGTSADRKVTEAPSSLKLGTFPRGLQLAVDAPDLHWVRSSSCSVTPVDIPAWVQLYSVNNVVRVVPASRKLDVYQPCLCGYAPAVVVLEGWDNGVDLQTSVPVPDVGCDPLPL